MAAKKARPAWKARPFERMADELDAMANELEAWAADDTTPEQSTRLAQIAARLRAASQDVLETLGDKA
jgi:hypothetical protein